MTLVRAKFGESAFLTCTRSCTRPTKLAQNMTDRRSLTLFRAKFGESAFRDVYQKLYDANGISPKYG